MSSSAQMQIIEGMQSNCWEVQGFGIPAGSCLAYRIHFQVDK